MPCDNLIFLHGLLTESLSRHNPACPIEYFVKIGLDLQVCFSKYFSIFLKRLCLGTFPNFEKNFSSFGNAIKQCTVSRACYMVWIKTKLRRKRRNKIYLKSMLKLKISQSHLILTSSVPIRLRYFSLFFVLFFMLLNYLVFD